jgi:hypothetical protein
LSAGQAVGAVGGGGEEEPEEMSVAVRAVYDMLLSSDRSIIEDIDKAATTEICEGAYTV